MVRKHSRRYGASFVTWTGVPPERFAINAGKEQISTFQSSEQGTRSFCRICGSQMFCQTGPEIIDIALAALHDRIDRDPEAHYYYDCRAEWTQVNDDLPRLGGEDGMQPL